MTSEVKMWKRIELPAELHRELEREAKVVHMSTQAYGAYLISRGLQIDRAIAQLPFHVIRNGAGAAASEVNPATCSHVFGEADAVEVSCIRCGLTLYRAK